MNDGSIYYCWSCDAHRRVVADPGTPPACPRCRQVLGDDARLRVILPAAPAPQAVFDFLARAARHRDLSAAG